MLYCNHQASVCVSCHSEIWIRRRGLCSCNKVWGNLSTDNASQRTCATKNLYHLPSQPATTSGTQTTVLVPSPSPTDPNDPLRWPKWKKHVAFTSVCAFAFLTNYGIGGLAPAFFILHLEFGRSMTDTSHLLLWPILVLGLFNFFWVPLANYFGKRPVFVFASLLLCLCYVWGAVATTFRSLLWSNIIAAFAGSSTEALGASIVNVSKRSYIHTFLPLTPHSIHPTT